MSSQTPSRRGRRNVSEEVAIAAQRVLEQNPYTTGRTVSCNYHRGVLVLEGRVSSYYQKQHAQEAVKDIDGVAAVVNKIEVGW
jgi:osmotically-inducible protein OsmY